MIGFLAGDQLRFEYTNYREETSVRHVIFIGLDYGEYFVPTLEALQQFQHR